MYDKKTDNSVNKLKIAIKRFRPNFSRQCGKLFNHTL